MRQALTGVLGAMRRVRSGVGNAKSPSGVPDGLSLLVGSVKEGAGTRKHLDLLLVG